MLYINEYLLLTFPAFTTEQTTFPPFSNVDNGKWHRLSNSVIHANNSRLSGTAGYKSDNDKSDARFDDCDSMVTDTMEEAHLSSYFDQLDADDYTGNYL